jgi:competence protein ComEA
MDPKAKYLTLKAFRLATLFAGLGFAVIAGNSVFTGKRPVADASRSVTPVSDSARRVNINTASLQQLIDLPTIGQVIGSRIIEYRGQHGPFRRTSDIIIIKGISEHKFRQLEGLITVE